MPTPVSMCLLNPKPKKNQKVNMMLAPLQRAPLQRAPLQRAPLQRAPPKSDPPTGATNLKSNTRNKMNISGLKNKKPCGRCGGAK